MAEACVILSDIHIDIMDYIKPAYCNEAQVGTFVYNCPLRNLTMFAFSSEACGQSLSGRIELTCRPLWRECFYVSHHLV